LTNQEFFQNPSYLAQMQLHLGVDILTWTVLAQVILGFPSHVGKVELDLSLLTQENGVDLGHILSLGRQGCWPYNPPSRKVTPSQQAT
jgi:hypothetical protein